MKSAILFDIDGTLMYAKGLGRPAFLQAFEVAYGQTYPTFDQDVSFVGATDTGVIRQMAKHLGITSTPAREEHFYIELASRLGPRLAQGPLQIYPGVPELLQALDNRGILMGTVTGNIRATAWSKLIHSQLAPHFSFGGYSTDAENRNDIAQIAMQRAAALGSQAKLLIGDTPKDIEAAHANGLPALAVCTGWVSAETLREAGADAVIDSFANLDKSLYTIESFLSC